MRQLLIGLALSVPTLVAQASSDYPAAAGGIDEPTAYHRSGLDNINLSNGAVSIYIPFASYTVDGGFSYSIGLYYNSSAWYFLPDGDSCPDPNGPGQITDDLWELRQSFSSAPHLGPMWGLGLGPRLEGPDTFRDVDGSTVQFRDEGINQTVAFSTDGSHYRLRQEGGLFVDAPSGVIYQFDGHGRPLTITDRFGKTVVSYAYAQSDEQDQTILTDSAGRRIVVDSGDMTLSYPVAHGQTAVVSFVTDERQVYLRESGPGQNAYACIDGEEYAQDGAPLKFLTDLVLADGSRFQFDYYTDEELRPGSTTEAASPAYLSELVLPSGGRYEYFYHTPGSQSLRYGSSISSLSSKQIYESDGDKNPATWRYYSSSHFSAGHTTVRDPLGNETVHYFDTRDIDLSEPGWNPFWFKGMSFDANQSITSDRGHKLYLSSETYEGTAANGVLLRQEYVRYVADSPGEDHFPNPGISPGDKEKLLKATATLYYDEDDDTDLDYTRETLNNEWDGFGHWRKMTVFDDTSSPEQTSRINWNSHLDPDNRPESGVWLLTTYDYITVLRAGQVKRTDYVFDIETGFLECKREYRDFGHVQGDKDLMELRLRGADDNVSEIQLMGADRQPLTGDGCDASLGTPSHIRTLEHLNGVLSLEQTIDPTTGQVLFKSTDRVMDPDAGVPLISRDPNGLATAYSYDLMGRMIWIDPPGNLPSSTASYCNSSQSGCDDNRFVRRTLKGAVVLDENISLFDGLGRKVEDRQTLAAVDSNETQILKTLYGYDNLDRLTDVSTTDVAPSPGTGTTTAYDRFGRAIRVTRPDGSVITTDYGGERETTTTYSVRTESGDRGFSRILSREDYRGVLTRVEEPSGVDDAILATTYRYDVTGTLTRAEAGGQVRSFTHDALGWQISASHPELGGVAVSMSDYDVLGNPGQTTTGTRTLTNHYDAVGRLTSVVEGNRPLTELYRDAERLIMAKRHNYPPVDPANPASGMDHYVVIQRLGYDPATGQLADLRASIVRLDGNESTHLGSDRLFSQKIDYDANGLPGILHYPDARQSGAQRAPSEISIGYNGLTPVQLRKAQTAGVEAEFSYHRGSVASIEYGNAVTQGIALDSSGMHRMGATSMRDPSGSLLWTSGTYAYDASGNIESIGSDSFRYDGTHRLTASTVSSANQSVSFDRFGNITSLTTAGTQVQMGIDPGTNRLQSVPGATFAYDEFGNIRQWKQRLLAYDAFDMVSASAMGDQVRQYVYGPDNKRIATVNPASGELRWTVRNVDGKVLSEYRESDGELNWARDYIYSGSQLLLAYHPDSTRYFHADHLGSTRAVTDAEGQIVARYDYHPFGGFAATSGPEAELETQLFTGHERDRNDLGDEDDLDYMLARYFAPHLGRFLSMDPVLGTAENPQSWNRYAYVRNNPISANDPTGMCENGDVAGAQAHADTPGPCEVEPIKDEDGDPVVFEDEITVLDVDPYKGLTESVSIESFKKWQASGGLGGITASISAPRPGYRPRPIRFRYGNPYCYEIGSYGPVADFAMGLSTSNLDFGCMSFSQDFQNGRNVGNLVITKRKFNPGARNRMLRKINYPQAKPSTSNIRQIDKKPISPDPRIQALYEEYMKGVAKKIN